MGGSLPGRSWPACERNATPAGPACAVVGPVNGACRRLTPCCSLPHLYVGRPGARPASGQGLLAAMARTAPHPQRSRVGFAHARTRRGRPSGWRACWPAARRRCRTPPPWPQTRPPPARRWSASGCPSATRTARRAPHCKCVAHFLLTCALHALPSAPLRGVSYDNPCRTDMCRSMCRCMRRSAPERLGGQCAGCAWACAAGWRPALPS